MATELRAQVLVVPRWWRSVSQADSKRTNRRAVVQSPVATVGMFVQSGSINENPYTAGALTPWPNTCSAVHAPYT
jgi:hypothetical protein